MAPNPLKRPNHTPHNARAARPEEAGEKGEEVARQVRRAELVDATDLPEHLRNLYMSAGEGLDDHQRATLLNLLITYRGIFASSDNDLGRFDAVQHRINVG